jgi:hypothetical protein
MEWKVLADVVCELGKPPDQIRSHSELRWWILD